MDEQKLTKLFRQAQAGDRMRVPPMTAVIARAEYAREFQTRRRYQNVVGWLSGLAGAGVMALIVLSPRGLPFPMSAGIVPVLIVGGVAILWAAGDERAARIDPSTTLSQE